MTLSRVTGLYFEGTLVTVSQSLSVFSPFMVILTKIDLLPFEVVVLMEMLCLVGNCLALRGLKSS